ncbi:hypothetical protein ACN4EE_07550 [Geminocystis sp. CENA526]|uniref:hypothetical protein n=1 Tax=Geminocystis sp. CENA526 TaxID=1355871 RepID=UPI003D6DAE1E
MNTITNETVKQQIDQLSYEQLIEVANFISCLQFRKGCKSINLDVKELSKLATDFATEDRELAEEGMNDYLNMLNEMENI